jgi:hypothetical protein
MFEGLNFLVTHYLLLITHYSLLTTHYSLPIASVNELRLFHGSNGIVGETCTHHQAVLKSVIHQKQVITDSSGQPATVWDLGGQPAKDSAKEYQRLFKEILGALS